VADPSHPDSRPAVSPEGPLRALRVPNPGTGINYAPTAQLSVGFADYTDAAAGVAMPEAAFSDQVLPVAGTDRGYRIMAGPRGCWAIFISNGVSLNLSRWDSEADAAALGLGATVLAPATVQYQCNGGILSIVQQVSVAAPAPGLLVYDGGVAPRGQIMLQLNGGKKGLWIPPGAQIRILAPTGFAATLGGIVREPLSGP